MKSEVTEQTTGINDRLIDEFLSNQGLGLNAKRRREAKRSMMRYLGYKTGYREELLADQTIKRARKIAAGVKQGDADYLEIARGLGAKRGKEANYDAASIQARLGGTKTRNQVIAGSLRAKAMASGNVARRSRRHAAVQKVDTLQDLSRSINHVMFSPNSHPTKKDQKAKAWVEKRLKRPKSTWTSESPTTRSGTLPGTRRSSEPESGRPLRGPEPGPPPHDNIRRKAIQYDEKRKGRAHYSERMAEESKLSGPACKAGRCPHAPRTAAGAQG